MTTKDKDQRNSSSRSRVARKPSIEFRRLSPSELSRLGLSEKSERYVKKSAKRLTARTPTISKRQLYQKKLSEQSGRRVTLEQRAREYLSGERQASTAAQASLRELAVESAALRRKYQGERVPRIREHLRNMALKAEGDYLDKDVYLREKAFAEAHIEIPEEHGFYQKWFNYGHVKRATSGRHNATGRTA